MPRLTGSDAIDYAEAHGLTLSKYTDPTEEAREGLTPDEAREIAREDPTLIWIDAPPRRYYIYTDADQTTIEALDMDAAAREWARRDGRMQFRGIETAGDLMATFAAMTDGATITIRDEQTYESLTSEVR